MLQSTISNLGDRLAALSAHDAQELCDYLEARHGITSPVPTLVIDRTAIDEPIDFPEPTEFDVLITDLVGKLGVIKKLREIFGWELRACKLAVDELPTRTAGKVGEPEAARLQAELEQSGAVVVVRPSGDVHECEAFV